MRKKVIHKVAKLQLIHLNTDGKKFNLLNAVVNKMKKLGVNVTPTEDKTK